MKKYVKPEMEIISFDVESAVMSPATATPTPMPYDPYSNATGVLSDLNTRYVPDSVDKKVWATMDDGENWNWDN